MEKKALKLLCVIDMQNDFISGSLGTEEAEAVVPAVVEKIANWDGQTIATRDTHFEQTYLSTQEGRYLPVKHCIRGTQGWEIEPRVAEALKSSRCIGIVDKEHFAEAPQAQSGSRTLADFVQSLKSEGSSLEITLIGVCTDICVVSNALMLKSMFPEDHFTVDSSCCAGTTPAHHDSALNVLRSCQIDVI
jgi:nicotinamidase/pyrazinamidase